MLKYLLIPLSLCLAAFCVQKSSPDDRFKVYIKQDNRIINKEADSVFRLKKKAFSIVLELSDSMGVMVHASYSRRAFQAARDSVSLEKFPEFESTAFAEGMFNKEEELFVADTGFSFWYYDNDKEHRFNKVNHLSDGKIEVERRIEKLTELSPKRKSIKVRKAKGDLYLIFISYSKVPGDLLGRTEIQREAVKIEWR